jgi:uncharacterized SAM-binding protein YcdF (DUF218 family)
MWRLRRASASTEYPSGGSFRNLHFKQHRPAGKFDVIIVLGAAVCAGGKPSPILANRVGHAVGAFKSGLAGKIIATGGVGRHPPAEALLMRDLAVSSGVSPDDIVVEDHARNTFESASLCSVIMRERAWSTALVVTDAYHLLRSVLTFRAFGVYAVGTATRRRPDTVSRTKWAYLHLRELGAIPLYLFRLAKLRYMQNRPVRSGSPT